MSGTGQIPVVSVVGMSGVGKTTALERIIRELKRRGYRVATVKHHAHRFEVDKPGKDTWRHTRAGSDISVISGPHQMVLMRRLESELPLDEVVKLIDGVDLILTEGYKRGDKPKIEVTRLERGTDLLCAPEELIALMADYPVDMPVPQFALEDATGVVDLLESSYLRNRRR